MVYVSSRYKDRSSAVTCQVRDLSSTCLEMTGEPDR